mgnify:CR=1 FL=1
MSSRSGSDCAVLHGRVSAETVLCGPGLERLYAAVSGKQLRGPEIDEAAWRGEPDAVHTHALFTRWLGRVAGNLALIAGARGGVYLAGGILPRWGARFDAVTFRRAFEDKAPYSAWLSAIPTFVITHPQPGLLGLAVLAHAAGMSAVADTIVASATPPGRGGIGIVRISGPETRSIGAGVLGQLPAPRHAAVAVILGWRRPD